MTNRHARKRRIGAFVGVIAITGLAAGCGPEVGSEEWCEDFEQTAAADITAEDSQNYAKHCILGQN